MFNMNSLNGNVSSPESLLETLLSPIEDSISHAGAGQNCMLAFSDYVNEFMLPFLSATRYFNRVEKLTALNSSFFENMASMLELSEFNFELSGKSCSGTLKAAGDYVGKEFNDSLSALFNTLMFSEGENLQSLMKRRTTAIKIVTHEYPKAIKEVEPEFGFHFERGENEKIMETDRFTLYRINPTDKSIRIRKSSKPILIIPPYVLGANILSFLPGDNRSYTHSFANQGVPTYIRILKDIDDTEAVQTMTGEDDAEDTRLFCEKMVALHGRKVTLNGYCQGGFSALCNLLSGRLDDLVDALITCVSPIDGTKSTGLSGFLKSLPVRYNNLSYGTRTLPNGNRVADGELMSWIYKLKSIEHSSPVVSFLRDLVMLEPQNGKKMPFNKTGIALNYWLKNERKDIPLEITKMSFASFNSPVSKDGTLPVKLFGQTLNFKRIKEKKIQWLICYGEKDDLVETSSSLIPTRFIEVETTPFPKGHVAIATSWSHPDSEYALHKRYKEGRYVGPVRFHLELDSGKRLDA